MHAGMLVDMHVCPIAAMSCDEMWRCVCMQLIPRIQMGGLMESYMHKRSKFNKLLRTYPVYAVTHKHLGLLGTKEYAIRLLTQTPAACMGTALPNADSI